MRLGTCVGALNGMGLNGGLVAIEDEFEGGMAIGCLDTDTLPGLVSSVGSCARSVALVVGVLVFGCAVVWVAPGVG